MIHMLVATQRSSSTKINDVDSMASIKTHLFHVAMPKRTSEHEVTPTASSDASCRCKMLLRRFAVLHCYTG